MKKSKKISLVRLLIEGLKGNFLWKKILRKGTGDDTFFILLPYSDDIQNEINGYALLYLDSFLHFHGKKNAVIITDDIKVYENAGSFSDNIVNKIMLDRNKINKLLQYYLLYEFDTRFFVASLEIPEGRNGTKLIGLGTADIKQVFATGVYRIYPFEKCEIKEDNISLAQQIFSEKIQ